MQNSLIPIQNHLQEQYGFQITEIRNPVLNKILYERSVQTRCHSLGNFCDQRLTGKFSMEWPIIIDPLTLKETHFSRNHDPFRYPEEHIIPEFTRTRWRWSSYPNVSGNIMNCLKQPPTSLPKYDPVICRNVLIYFTADDQRGAVHGLTQ
jgi:chemotaxis methyl-accepting protein methylase